MMKESSKSFLSRDQIRQALAMVREEQQAHPISSAQRKQFFWYGISVAVFFGSILYGLLLLAFSNQSEGAWDWWMPFPFLSFAFLMFGSFLSMVLLFFWNMKLIWQTWREFRLTFSTKLWQLTARARTGRRWPRRLMIGFGSFFLACFCVGVLSIPIVGIPLTVALFAFFFLRFARRRLDMLGNAESLAAFLTQLNATQGRAGIDQVAISTAIFNEIGAIEDLHIQRRRDRAMAELSHGSQGYAVLKSRAMIADIAKLEEASQLQVETSIAELASEPRLPNVARESDGVWRIPVKETPYEIVCRIDEAARRIEFLSLAQDHGMPSTRPTEEAPRG